MNSYIYLAWQQCRHNKYQSIITVIALSICISLPLLIEYCVDSFEQRLRNRANDTEIIIGSKNSKFDLLFHGLEFRQENIETIPFSSLSILDKSVAKASVPLFSIHKSQSFPIIGISKNYYAFRNLSLREGVFPKQWGKCVIGSEVAKQLQLKIGDSIRPDLSNPYDINAEHPLMLTVCGILLPGHSADNKMILTHLETAWIIAGYGHGHEAKSEHDHDQTDLIEKSKLNTHTQISDATFKDFHFHHDHDKLPLTAILIQPKSEKETFLIRGQFETVSQSQAIYSPQLIDYLMEKILKLKSGVHFITFLNSLLLLMILSFTYYLSLKVRKNELLSLKKLGCSKYYQFILLNCEFLIIMIFSLSLSAILYLPARWLIDNSLFTYLSQ